MSRLRVAIIGCGHIAQWVHIPYLRELDDRYEVVAACDLSAKLVQRVAGYFQIPATFTDYAQLLDKARPDVCLITTLDHYPPAIAALEAGAHLLVEKPMCWLLHEAEHLAERAAQLRRVVQVGYHKRYDPNYRRGLALMQAAGNRRLLHLRCVIGPNAAYTADFWPGWKVDDLPAMPPVTDKIRRALGSDAPDHIVNAYGLMGGLSTHTFSIFRGLYPEVPNVLACRIPTVGRGYSALMATSDGVPVTLDTAVVSVKGFDEEMALYAQEHIIKVNFPSPFLKNAETQVLMQTMDGTERVEQRFLTSNAEAYKCEWEALYDAIVHGAPVVTPATEGVMDIRWMLALVDAARRAA